MMRRFRQSWRQSDLERRLRAERPEPRDDFVRMLADQSRSEGRRRHVAPRLALVGALSAVLLAALGAVGSVGYAGNAISSFSTSIRDVVHVSQTSGNSNANKGARGTKGASANGNGHKNANRNGNGHSGSTGSVEPFQDQYRTKFPICHKPGTPAQKTLHLPLSAFPGHLGHGDFAGECP